MKKLTSLIILFFSQCLFLFSLSAFSLHTLLLHKSREILVYSYNHTSIKTSGMCVIGLCILFGGLGYSRKQIKKDNKNLYAQEKKHLERITGITQIIGCHVKNIFSSFGNIKKNVKKSKKITENLSKNSSNTQKKILNIQASINNVKTQCNSLEQSGDNIIQTFSHMKKKSKHIKNEITNITDKKIKTNKTSEHIIDLYNEQTVVPLPQIEEKLHEKIVDCSDDIKQSKEKVENIIKINKNTIMVLQKNSLETKNQVEKTIKHISLNNEKMETV